VKWLARLMRDYHRKRANLLLKEAEAEKGPSMTRDDLIAEARWREQKARRWARWGE
jgi:hypothetical protein